MRCFLANFLSYPPSPTQNLELRWEQAWEKGKHATVFHLSSLIFKKNSCENFQSFTTSPLYPEQIQ